MGGHGETTHIELNFPKPVLYMKSSTEIVDILPKEPGKRSGG